MSDDATYNVPSEQKLVQKRYLFDGSCFGNHFFCFMNKVLKIGGDHPYKFKDLFELDDNINFINNYDLFLKYREEHLKKKPNASFAMLMFRWGFNPWIAGFLYFNFGQV